MKKTQNAEKIEKVLKFHQKKNNHRSRKFTEKNLGCFKSSKKKCSKFRTFKNNYRKILRIPETPKQTMRLDLVPLRIKKNIPDPCTKKKRNKKLTEKLCNVFLPKLTRRRRQFKRNELSERYRVTGVERAMRILLRLIFIIPGTISNPLKKLVCN